MRLFMCLILVFAISPVLQAQTPQSDRSRAAINRVEVDLQHDLSALGLEYGAPVFLQITKHPAELIVYVETNRGTYEAFRTYPICAYSGGLGPKKRQGDGKSPEGFYHIRPQQMNPASSYHLSFNLGYPNAYDRSKAYTGDFLMVHGRCVSIGCYAMTDPAIEELWTLMTAAFANGQSEIPVHIFPYRMNWPMRMAAINHPDRAFWQDIAPAWKAFFDTRIPPKISVARGQYIITPRHP